MFGEFGRESRRGPLLFALRLSRLEHSTDQANSCPGDWRLSAITCAQLRTTPGSHHTSQHYRIEGFKGQGGPHMIPHYAVRRQSLGQ